MFSKFFEKTLFLGLCFICSLPVFSDSAQTMSAKESLEARNKLISYSKQFIGVPYLYGGIDKNGMDCSGFIFTVARESIGVQLPRSTSALYAAVRVVDDSLKEPGDLLFFKTVGNKISHTGLYLGNDQFIHSASDGPNTGVIISSLKEAYWSRTYAGAGQFLPSANTQQIASADNSQSKEDSGSKIQSVTKVSSTSQKQSFFHKVEIDGTLSGDWNLFTANRFLLNWRGITLDIHGRYTKSNLQPGVGISLSYDPQMKVFKIPLIFSITVLQGLRVYAGPVFSIGNPIEPGTKNTDNPSFVTASIFPGILGVAWQTPSFVAGKTRISFVQDIHYCVYNDESNAALPFVNSIAAGLVFSTGLRVTFSLSDFI